MVSNTVEICWKTLRSVSPKTGKGVNSSPELEDYREYDDGDGKEREKVHRFPTLKASTDRPDRRKRGKEMLKKEGEVKAMQKKIDGLMWARNEYTEKRKQEKVEMEENKNQEKRTR